MGRIAPKVMEYYNSSVIKALDELQVCAFSNDDATKQLMDELQILDIGYILVHERLLKEKYGEANIDVRTGKIEYNLEK